MVSMNPTGVWLLDEDTGELRYMEAHAGSAVRTAWPRLWDRAGERTLAHAVDWLLDAAAASRERLETALRARQPGSLGYVDSARQTDYWWRVAASGSVGAQAQLFVGDLTAGSYDGIIVDDADDLTSVTGFAGGTGNNQGQGPGGGGAAGGGGANGGHGTPATGNSFLNGKMVSKWAAWEALVDHDFTVEKLAIGGGGGAGGVQGGDGGDGLVRASSGDLEETTARTLRGQSRTGNGGNGSGGGVYVACAGAYTLNAAIDLRGPGGAGDGRLTVWHLDGATIPTAMLTDVVTATFRMLPGLPRGGGRYI